MTVRVPEPAASRDNPGVSANSETNPGPLAGVRVLDLSSVLMGPLATQILGDWGADVIAVESAAGDTNRFMGPGPVRRLSDISLNLLRNKRNAALDLKHPDGHKAFLAVASTVDVMVTNLRPGPLTRLGLDYERVAQARPDIVYCQAAGFASDGPRADEPAYDDVIQAAAGVPDLFERAGLEPRLAPTLLADKVCGLMVANAVLAGLYHRSRTGEGQRIEVPMAEVLSAFLLVEHSSGAATSSDQVGAGYRRILTEGRRPQRTLDGWVMIFPYLQGHWDLILTIGGAAELVDDPRLSRQARQIDPGFGYSVLNDVVATKTTAEWLELCSAEGIPATEITGLDTRMASYPLAEHPVAGTYRQIPPAVRFSRTPATVRSPAPMVGQHTEEVLAEAGYGPEQIKALRETGALSHPLTA